MTPQRQRDNLELAVLFKGDRDAIGRQAIVRAFEEILGMYVLEIFAEDVSPERVLFIRAKAMGVIDSLTSMGVGIANAMDSRPVKESVKQQVRSSLGTD